MLASRVLIAPGSHHLRVVREGAPSVARPGSDRPANCHRPSVDVLFSSCAEAADEATSAVFGMTRVAIARGAAERVLPLQRLAGGAVRLATRGDGGRERAGIAVSETWCLAGLDRLFDGADRP